MTIYASALDNEAENARAGDLSERVGFDIEQARSIAKVQVWPSFRLE